jgi:hypothetical protein
MKRLLYIVIIILVVVGGYYLLINVRKSAPVPEGAVSIEFPLKNGKYIVMFSGRSNGVHISNVEKYALDIVKHSSIQSLLIGSSLQNNVTYGTAIYSPCVGYVRELQDGVKDQPLRVKDPSAGGGNDIVIGCDGFNVYMAHIKSGTFKVKKDDKVIVGQELAQVGNSGNTDGPHLHIHAFKENGGDIIPLPMIFNGRYLYKFDVIDN